MRIRVLAGSVLLLVLAHPRVARTDASSVQYRETDERGRAVHVLPLAHQRVRMVAEKVVLVPFWDDKLKEPRFLCHVWYDFLNEGPRTRVQMGFPELKAFYSLTVRGPGGRDYEPEQRLKSREQGWTRPTISAFAARAGGRTLAVNVFPGVGRYRRWFTFAVDLEAHQTLRIHNTYVSSLARTIQSAMPRNDVSWGDRWTVKAYSLEYLLHTGASWHGTIGQGEILLFDSGRLRGIRRFADLEPTRRDDVKIEIFPTREDEGRHYPANDVEPHRLLGASGHLESAQLDTHVGLAADGDPGTFWVSPRGQAQRSFIRLPSRADRKLLELRLESGQPGPGRGRPARVAVRCLSGKRSTLIVRRDLPDTAGPHRITPPRAVQCEAVRVDLEAVHGDPGAPVAIAELDLRHAGEDEGSPGRWAIRPDGTVPEIPSGALISDLLFIVTSASERKDPLDRPIGQRAPLAADDPAAFEIVGIDRVAWSGDGSLVHYWLQLEDYRARPVGVRLGYFMDVATGKVVRTYAIDGEGTLPEPYRRDWEQAMSYEEGAAFLARHGFQPGVASRTAPATSRLPGQRLDLRARLKPEQGTCAITPVSDGFTWTVAPAAQGREGKATASVELWYAAQGQPERRLASRALSIDLGFAHRHVAVRQARQQYYLKAAADLEDWERPGREVSLEWHALMHPSPAAYGGAARVFWHPRGEAALVFLAERKDYGSRHPDPTEVTALPECWESDQKVCPWEVQDDPRHQVSVTVLALVPRQPTTLLAPYVAPEVKPRATSRARSKPAARARRGGCGCDSTASPFAGVAVPVLLLLIVQTWRRRRREQAVAKA